MDKTNGYVSMVIDNLRKAGSKTRRGDERLVFESFEPWPGEWINATGDYTDAEGVTRRVAVSIGPEHGTVGPVQVKEAAKEALRGVGFDILVVCGFAFDAAVGETGREFGNLTVLPTKMNPDLAMGAGLLKKTGSGNLFMVFGEPDVLVKTEDGEVTVELTWSRHLRPDDGRGAVLVHKRHRLLVHRHRLRPGELLRTTRLLHRR